LNFGSPSYWVIVGAASVMVAGLVVFVGSDREELPGYRAAVVLYIIGWGAVGSLSALWLLYGIKVGPLNEPLGAALPAAVSVAIAASFLGGHLILALAALTIGLTAVPRVIVHPHALWTKLTRRERTPALTDAELRTAEAYDAKWQMEDRARNQRFGTPRRGRQRRKRH
jgi:hypothetical protein